MSNFLRLFFISFFIISITYSQDNSSLGESQGFAVGSFMLGAVTNVDAANISFLSVYFGAVYSFN